MPRKNPLPPKPCEWCNQSFVPTALSQRFCSRKCWFAFHRGTNHKQHKRFPVTCEVCEKVVMRTATQINRSPTHQYCSRKCADSTHGKKITGSRNANWKGGSLASRGPSWESIRYAIRQKQGFKCGICGMNEKDHRAKYNRSLDVHHKSLYRLSLSNEDDNLIALCIKCHAMEEAKANKGLTPLDKDLISQNVERMKRLGLDHKRDRRIPCPRCGKLKTPKAKHCLRCKWELERIANMPKHTCPMCGGSKNKGRKICRQCWKNSRKLPIGDCLICGAHLKTHHSTICHPCSLKLKNKLSAKTKRYTKEQAIAEIRSAL